MLMIFVLTFFRRLYVVYITKSIYNTCGAAHAHTTLYDIIPGYAASRFDHRMNAQETRHIM